MFINAKSKDMIADVALYLKEFEYTGINLNLIQEFNLVKVDLIRRTFEPVHYMLEYVQKYYLFEELYTTVTPEVVFNVKPSLSPVVAKRLEYYGYKVYNIDPAFPKISTKGWTACGCFVPIYPNSITLTLDDLY